MGLAGILGVQKAGHVQMKVQVTIEYDEGPTYKQARTLPQPDRGDIRTHSSALPRPNMTNSGLRTTIVGGVIAAVIAGLILSLAPGWSATAHFIWNIVRFIWSAVRFIWLAHIPVWLLVLLCGLVATLWLILKRAAGSRSSLEWVDVEDVYTQDRFFGAVWRWHYYAGQPSGLAPFCPTCDMQLVYHNDGVYYAAGVHTILICERCQRGVGEFEGDYDQLERRLVREIQRKIRTGEHKQS
jgi:hypothetical protein